MQNSSTLETRGRGWWVRHAPTMKTVIRLVFGVVWLIDGALKFSSGFVDNFPGAVQTSADNAPPGSPGGTPSGSRRPMGTRP